MKNSQNSTNKAALLIREAVNFMITNGKKESDAELIAKTNFYNLNNSPTAVITIEALCKES